jgi:hypothetical protein
VCELLFKNIKKYSTFLDEYICYLPEISSGKSKYELMKLYLQAYPTNEKKVEKIFIFASNKKYNNLKLIFFAQRQELLTLRQYGKLDLLTSILTTNEKHILAQFIDDSIVSYSENIGVKLFSNDYYFSIRDWCKKYIEYKEELSEEDEDLGSDEH